MTNLMPPQLTTVGELSRYLKTTRQSPETLARRLQISNMTIRRLLRRPAATPIPPKYLTQFQHLTAIAPGNFSHLLGDLETSGAQMKDADELRAQLDEKLHDRNIAGDLRRKIKSVAAGAFGPGPLRNRALCIGALLYLINPVDFIPDSLGVVGYLDDFAIITLVCDAIKQPRKRI